MMSKTKDEALLTHLAGLLKIVKDAIGLAEQREEYSESYFKHKAREHQHKLEGWLAFCECYEDDELRKLAKHIKKHLQEWFTFLRVEGVPATNNHAERQLRPSVVVRKTNGCHKTLAGALKHAVLMSLIVTCEQQNRRFLDLALELWREPNPGAIPMASLEVDPILWTKKGHSLATLLPAFLAGNPWLILHRRHACGIAFSPGETEVGSAGEHPAKG